MVVLPDDAGSETASTMLQAVETGGLEVLRLIDRARAATLATGPDAAVLGAALLAEEMARG